MRCDSAEIATRVDLTPERIELHPGCTVVRSLPLPTGGDAVIRWSTNPPQRVVASAVFVPSVAASPPSRTHHDGTEGKLVVCGGAGSLRLTISHVSTGWFYDAATTLTMHTSIAQDAAHPTTEATAHAAEADEYTGMMECAIKQVRSSDPHPAHRERFHTRSHTEWQHTRWHTPWHTGWHTG